MANTWLENYTKPVNLGDRGVWAVLKHYIIYIDKEQVVSHVSDSSFIRTLSIVFGTIAVAFFVMIAIARALVY